MRFRPPPFEVPDSGDPFVNDKMERRPQIEALTRLVGNIEGPCVLAINAQWGFGKTAFLKMWAQHLRNEDYPVAEFNAWDTDFSDDPLMALYATLEDHFGKLPDSDRYEKVLKAGWAVVSTLASATIPGASVLSEVVKAAQESTETSTRERLDRYREAQESITKFKQALSEIAGDKPLVVCVDELDRCRPSYAIEFLEATKHVFEVDGVIFILAVNLSELANSVRALYGADFNARMYLRRFIDLPIYLPLGDRRRFLQELMNTIQLVEIIGPHYKEQSILDSFVLKAPHVSLRDIEQGICDLGVILSAAPKGPTFSTYQELTFCLVVFRMVAPEIYQDFSSSKISDLEALRSLNRLLNRPDDWWKTRYADDKWSHYDAEWKSNQLMELLLIGWSIATSRESQSVLLELRRAEAQGSSGLEQKYASAVVQSAESVWTEERAEQRFAHIANLVNMIADDKSWST